MPSSFTLIAAFFASVILWVVARQKKGITRLPPGPKGELILGNARQIPPSYAWHYFTDLAKKYGDVVHLSIFGDPVIVLGSYKAIEETILKKSAVFSGRPHLVMCGDLVGWRKAIGVSQPTARWQMYRKMAHQFIGPQVVLKHSSLVDHEMRLFVNRFLDGPRTGLVGEFKFGVARCMLELVYGITPSGREDDYFTYMEETIKVLGLSSQPGKFLVDTFPFLQYVPAWFPLAGFKRQALEWRRRLLLGMSLPFDKVKDDMTKGIAKTSLVSSVLEDPPAGYTEDIIKWGFGSLYAGSIDSMGGAMSVFLLSMVLHPHVQEKAKNEIERVVGKDRLPSLADRKDLPYVDAVMKEVMRWFPIVPMSFPYKTLEDYQCRDWIIPKDSVILTNVWAITRDPERYPSPEEFIPERFLDNPDLLTPQHYYFGLGRRICPGQHLADIGLWSAMATLLAAVKISKALDEHGKEITPPVAFTGGLTSEALPFPYKAEPRSAAAASLLRDVVLNTS